MGNFKGHSDVYRIINIIFLSILGCKIDSVTSVLHDPLGGQITAVLLDIV